MKKLLIILGSLLLIFIILLLLLPVFLRNNITDIVENQTAKYIDAKLDIKEIDLSMFKNFPNLNVSIRDIVISGKNEFSGDTLISIPLFSASVNVISLWGKEVVINRLLLKDARFKPMVSPAGHPNWDIIIKDTTSSQAHERTGPSEEKESQEIRFNDIRIENLFVQYRDEINHASADIKKLNLNLSGNFAATQTLLKTELTAEGVSFKQGKTLWINNTNINWKSEIAANLEEQVFDIQENNLSVNDLQLALKGRLGVHRGRYDTDLQLKAPDSRFESLLALVPKEFQTQLKGLETTGNFTLDIVMKGSYYKNHLPFILAQLAVHNASIKYPDLPESIRDINLTLVAKNPGGPADSTQIDLRELTFNIAGNPFAMNLLIANPVNPDLRGSAKGSLNFSSLKKALPLDNISLEGDLYTDITFSGKYAYIEKEEYEKFNAQGEIRLNQIMVKNSAFPQGISIPTGNISITPSTLRLDKLEAKIQSSDLTLTGEVSNYLPYLFKNQTLKGRFSLISQQINLNEFILKGSSSKASSAPAPASNNTLLPEIPANLRLQLHTDIKKLLFDQLLISNIKGDISLKDATASFEGLKMEMLKGFLQLSGSYQMLRPEVPHFNMLLDVSDLDIHAASESFRFIRQNLPVMLNCEGYLSANCHFAADLHKSGTLDMKTANGSGYLASRNILINQNPSLEKLASILNNDELSRISISALKIDFEVQNGNLTVKPFKTSLAGNPASIYGHQTVEGNIDYTLSLNVRRKYFGKDINNVLKNIPGSNNIESLDLDVKIEGTLDKPEVKPDLSKALKTIQKEAQKELKKKAQKGLMKELNKLFK